MALCDNSNNDSNRVASTSVWQSVFLAIWSRERLFCDDDLMLFYLFLCLYTVGNKDDNPERKVVEKEDAMKFAEQMGIQVFETSAKDNKNVEEVCDNLVNL